MARNKSLSKRDSYIWFDGRFMKSEAAHVNVLTHSLQYGTGIFEGIRSFSYNNRTSIFRLREHAERFINTAKICNMKFGLNRSQIEKAIIDTVRKNGSSEFYIRPFAFYNDSHIGLSVEGKKVSTIIAAVPFGAYFVGKEKGLRCGISSWRRINPAILPTEAKLSGNYANSLLASMEAKASGYDEAILLSQEGFVAEGAAENIFLVQNGKLVTPSKEADILMGITRDTVIKLAETMAITVEEREVHREELYTSDEAFFTGTAAGIAPITHIDGRKLGNGNAGAITSSLAANYAKAVHGELEMFKNWCTFV